MAESDDGTPGTVRRVLVGAIVSLVILGGTLYAVFWLPFRESGNPLPRTIEILPLEQEPTPTAATGTAADDSGDGYGWVDQEAGIARIPLSKAMDVVVDTLPVSERAAEDLSERERHDISTDAGSGRFVPRDDRQ